MRCLSCGTEKDTAAKEVYPYPDEGLIDDPLDPLFVIECQGPEWRAAIVCHECFHKLNPDMWISENCWRRLNPITPFEKLPPVINDPKKKFSAESYARLTA